jgi:hypothetical protein
MRVLTLGVSGNDVSRWERFLTRAGFLEDRPSGFFSPAVAKSTEAFRDTNGLAKTGKADEQTLAAALGQGLLDTSLDEPSPPDAEEKGSNWAGNGPLFVAIAAAVGTVLTGVAVEWAKNDANIAAEREKLRSSLIQQAMQIAPTPNGTVSWTRGQAQLEVVSRLEAYVRLGLVDLPQKTLDDFLHDLGSVPVLAPPPASVSTPAPATGTGTTSSTSAKPATDNTTLKQQRVFVQFAGMRREDVIAMARSLSTEWRVQGASGERTGHAAGRKEVTRRSNVDFPELNVLA